MYELTILKSYPDGNRQNESIGIKDLESARAALDKMEWRYRKDTLVGNQVNEEIRKKENTILFIDLWEKREKNIWHGVGYYVFIMNEDIVRDLRNINE